MPFTGRSPQQRLSFIQPHGFSCFQMSSYYSVVPWGSNNHDLFADSEMLLFSLAEFLTMYHSFLFASKVLGKLSGFQILLLCSQSLKTRQMALSWDLPVTGGLCLWFWGPYPVVPGWEQRQRSPMQSMVWFAVPTCLWLAGGWFSCWQVHGVCVDATWLLLWRKASSSVSFPHCFSPLHLNTSSISKKRVRILNGNTSNSVSQLWFHPKSE